MAEDFENKGVPDIFLGGRSGGKSEIKGKAKSDNFQVLDEGEAVSVISGKENKEKNLYAGMAKVYDYIIQETEKDLLHPISKIESHFATQNFKIKDILSYLTKGVLGQFSDIPIVHLHGMLKYDKGAIHFEPIYASSHKASKIKDACNKYNKISVEEIIKRVNHEKTNLPKILPNYEDYLARLIKQNEFYKSYVLWEIDSTIEGAGENSLLAINIIFQNVLPLLKEQYLSRAGIYYRDLDSNFRNYGLKPITILNDSELLSRRYRFLAKEILLKQIIEKLGDADISIAAEKLTKQFASKTEKADTIASLAKSVFDKVTQRLANKKPSSGMLQVLQIALELFILKSNINEAIDQERQESAKDYLERVRKSKDLYFFPKKDLPPPIILENLKNNSNMHAVNFPIRGEIVDFFLHSDNAEAVCRELEKNILTLRGGGGETRFKNMDEIQVRVEVLDLMLPGKVFMRDLKAHFLDAKVSGFTRFIQFVLKMFGGKKKGGTIEEKLWDKIKSETDARSKKVIAVRELKAKREVEKERKQKAKELIKQKGEASVATSSVESQGDSDNSDDGGGGDGDGDGEEIEAKGPSEAAIVKLNDLIGGIPKLWNDFFTNISSATYKPPMTTAVAQLIDIEPDKLSIFIRQNSGWLRDKGFAYINLKRINKQVYITRPILKKYGRLICDLFESIDINEFNNKLRNEKGTARMDFAHEMAAYLHGKGLSEKNAAKLQKSYDAFLENSSMKAEEEIVVAKFILSQVRGI